MEVINEEELQELLLLQERILSWRRNNAGINLHEVEKMQLGLTMAIALFGLACFSLEMGIIKRDFIICLVVMTLLCCFAALVEKEDD